MRRILLTLIFTVAAAALHAMPDSLDYRCDYYFNKLAQHKTERIQPQDVVMLGNSLTERGAWAEYFPGCSIRNRGIGGDCVAGMAARLDGIAAGRPRAIFIMTGVNDLIFSKIAPETLLAQYERMLDTLRAATPGTKIYIQSLLPLDESRSEEWFTGKNARITAFNALLRRMAFERGLPYIDLWSRMEREGKLPAEYTVDGIHLSPAGYAVWCEALRPYLYPEETRCGTVTCDGHGVAGVVVSDGVQCTVTDSLGRFALPHDDTARFLFVSTPAGYSSPEEQGVVRFFLPAGESRERYDFTLRRNAADDTRHGFVAIADPQLFDRGEFRLLERAAKDIRRTVDAAGRPMHGICAGDITSGDHDFYPQYNAVMARTGIPFRNTMGNHDMKLWGRSHETSPTAYENMYGPSYYSYNVGRVHYVVLDDNFYIGRDWFYIGYLDERQLAWLEQDLRFVPAGSTVIVTLHIPTMFAGKERLPFDYKTSERSLCNFRALHAMLEPYRAHIVSGHMHTATNCDIRERLYEHTVAALSGAWWQGPVCTDGTPAGYAVFEIDGDDVSWYYKAVDRPRDYQLKVYDEWDDPAFAGRIVANVWDSDPAWQVELCADGGEPVAMTRTRALDPEARQLYADASKLAHKWIAPTPSDHYYSAPLPAGARRIRVTARDRFGRVYRAEKRIREPLRAYFTPAADTAIRFVGRAAQGDDGSLAFDWSGCYFTFRFDGTRCALRVADTGRNYYNITIDGQSCGVVTTSGADSTVVLADALPRRMHIVRVQKRTEGEQGRTILRGVVTDAPLAAPPAAPGRHIEFIGDSHTCGYGTEGLSVREPFTPQTENCDLAWGCIVARYFDADYTLIAHSGQGVVRNYGDEREVSVCTMRERMLRTFDMDSTVRWDFRGYRPDLVVVKLGSNDVSTDFTPSEQAFVDSYALLLRRLREGYGDVPVLCVAPSDNTTLLRYVERFVQREQDPHLFFTAMLPGITNWDNDMGANFHPNHRGHRKLAMSVIPYIATVTGWEMPDRNVE